jgi:hypothetical protein
MPLPCERRRPFRARRLEPQDLDQVGDGVELKIASHNHRVQSNRRADDEGVGIRDRKPSLYPGCFEGMSERIRYAPDREVSKRRRNSSAFSGDRPLAAI